MSLQVLFLSLSLTSALRYQQSHVVQSDRRSFGKGNIYEKNVKFTENEKITLK